MEDVTKLFLRSDEGIHRAIEVIQAGAVGIALIVDENFRLVGTLTDGDIRRGMLGGVGTGEKIEHLFAHRPESHLLPTVARIGTPADELITLMRNRGISQIPLLDDEDRVVDLALLMELIKDGEQELSAVVMAGGFGKRLHPLTKQTPKPMLPLDGRPMMERTIEQLRKSGIGQVFVTTHFKADVIADHFRDGSDFGVQIEYLNESEPLGTAGALGLLEECENPVLVINGDILTQLNFRSMWDFHKANRAEMTVGVRKYESQVPYGVVDIDGVNIVRLEEKPVSEFFVNAGIYLLEPEVHAYISPGERSDMTDLIEDLLQAGRRVVGFPIGEYWLDIGHFTDYERAVKDAREGRV